MQRIDVVYWARRAQIDLARFLLRRSRSSLGDPRHADGSAIASQTVGSTGRERGHAIDGIGIGLADIQHLGRTRQEYRMLAVIAYRLQSRRGNRLQGQTAD